jgi:hypothetical protein
VTLSVLESVTQSKVTLIVLNSSCMNSTAKQISASAINALQDALTSIYWFKNDLKRFIRHSIQNHAIIDTIDWDQNPKFQSVSELLERMMKRPDMFQDDLLSLMSEVVSIADFSHLKRLEDGERKAKDAKDKVDALQKHVEGHLNLKEEKEKANARRRDHQDRVSFTRTLQEQLSELNKEFSRIAVESNHQKRGYLFEDFLNKLFRLFDLDPKAPFKISGEQIDGAFTFDNADYLLEAKWQSAPVNASLLYEFGGKISGKLKNTLGLFVSIEGFSLNSDTSRSDNLKAMILMDGADLVAILEGRISLTEALYRKRRHASQTGEIMFRIIGY